MFSVSEFLFCTYDNVYGGDITNNDEAIQYAQAVFSENGDDDDDVIYDYAPAA
ncbi:unnamed protein product [Brassica rapa]|uniref:Uncharacterized protein n=2 Tax=Brassica TaxID=3705 RepID=A0A3P6D301_BRACM|nr:unnamed protein product [Brassica napus]CAG7909458.1 unnamed protein product [Brassica rapa]VDD17191.1 unnamed protein product [Brassica rapa]